MLQRCETCKWWRLMPEAETEKGKVGNCTNVGIWASPLGPRTYATFGCCDWATRSTWQEMAAEQIWQLFGRFSAAELFIKTAADIIDEEHGKDLCNRLAVTSERLQEKAGGER